MKFVAHEYLKRYANYKSIVIELINIFRKIDYKMCVIKFSGPLLNYFQEQGENFQQDINIIEMEYQNAS